MLVTLTVMSGLFVFGQRSLLSSFVFTLVKDICHFFMYGLFVFSQIILLSCFVVTLITVISHSFMLMFEVDVKKT